MNGILMKPDMHLATRELRKTVTRRTDGLKEINQEPDRWVFRGRDLALNLFYFYAKDYVDHIDGDPHMKTIKPRYQVGEVVYIKEAWRIIGAFANSQNDFGIEYLTAGMHEVKWWRDNGNEMNYPIDEKVRSPLFLPEKYARSFIKILDVRAERLQEITPSDCVSEGASAGGMVLVQTTMLITGTDNLKDAQDVLLKCAYHELWDSINKEHQWESNPWVFRYEFKLQEAIK